MITRHAASQIPQRRRVGSNLSRATSMSQFPQLNQEDLDHLNVVMKELLVKSEAHVALLVEKGRLPHPPVRQPGLHRHHDLRHAGLERLQRRAIHGATREREEFHEHVSAGGTLQHPHGERGRGILLLVVVFPTHLTVGSMKYYASPAARSIAQRIEVASSRSPETGLDLSDLDPRMCRIFSARKVDRSGFKRDRV